MAGHGLEKGPTITTTTGKCLFRERWSYTAEEANRYNVWLGQSVFCLFLSRCRAMGTLYTLTHTHTHTHFEPPPSMTVYPRIPLKVFRIDTGNSSFFLFFYQSIDDWLKNWIVRNFDNIRFMKPKYNSVFHFYFLVFFLVTLFVPFSSTRPTRTYT